jgi:hypothetical protein
VPRFVAVSAPGHPIIQTTLILRKILWNAGSVNLSVTKKNSIQRRKISISIGVNDRCRFRITRARSPPNTLAQILCEKSVSQFVRERRYCDWNVGFGYALRIAKRTFAGDQHWPSPNFRLNLACQKLDVAVAAEGYSYVKLFGPYFCWRSSHAILVSGHRTSRDGKRLRWTRRCLRKSDSQWRACKLLSNDPDASQFALTIAAPLSGVGILIYPRQRPELSAWIASGM